MEDICRGLPAPEEVGIFPEDLAEIIFTSGTTGDPKGVTLTHRNITSNLSSVSQYVPGKASDRLLSVLPLSHMFEQMGGLLLALRVGANITYATSRQPTVLFRALRERKVTIMLLVPQALDLFMKGIEREVVRLGKERVWRLSLKIARYLPFRLRRPLFRKVHKRFGGSLGLFFVGGAALDPELGEKWKLLGVNVIQGYGATEASPIISCHKMETPRFDSAGPPIPGMEVRITDDGEILLKGPNVTPGYWEAPDKTDAAFTNGWYKTGDQGFLDEEGCLHIKGRTKDMIVLPSGQNVYPEDIEAVLKKHPAVADAVVVGLSKGSAVEVHATFILDDPSQSDEVASWANHQLAEHQQIRGHSVWPEEDFPRTHTLKVKKGLVTEALTGAAATAPDAELQSRTSAAGGTRGLEHLIAEVGGLTVDQVTPEKTLGTELNLDSLGRVELLSAVEEELGVYVDEGLVTPATSVRELKEMVGQGSDGATATAVPRWGMSPWCRMLRGLLQRSLIFPSLRLAYRVRVTGRENLGDQSGPVLFAANHNLGLDSGLIIKAMPLQWRRRLAIAGAAELWRNPIFAIMNPLFGNAFPFSREGAIRASLDNLGRILDEGWSVLIYPEGKLTKGGPIQPFLSGTGLLAVEGRVPVVPLCLRVNRSGSPAQLPVLKRGDVEIRFGKPISFAPGTEYQEATREIENAVKAL